MPIKIYWNSENKQEKLLIEDKLHLNERKKIDFIFYFRITLNH